MSLDEIYNARKRSTAYAMKRLGWSAEQADTFRAPIWDGSDYPIWEAFISQMQQRLAVCLPRC